MRRFLLLLPLLALPVAFAGEPEADPYANRVAKASDEWKKTIQRMQLPKRVQAELFAAEPHVANIVSFTFDEKGRCYVAETFRLHAGVTDNRGHMDWLDADLASRTVDDRVAIYKKYLKDKFATYAKDQDRVRLVEDTDGDGKADRATVFAGGFKNAADGIGSGVLARNGKVWYTCIPDLWLLQDTKGTGHADVKKSLHTGFGVHVAFLGHDLHGLTIGPDGLIYFSIGDRGLNVKAGEHQLVAPDTGSVLRCNPDGSNLQIFATGLRNPQELAFDEYGNLFTGDNNADGGDKARWVHVVEGGDSGWRIGYQYLPSLGPWNAEKLWHTAPANTGSYLLPPLAHIGNGPSGLTYHPGTSLLPERYQKHFFLCDFRGSGGGSGVHSFALKPRGASFEVTDQHQFAWSVLATDCDFGPDGGFYVSDWVDGWGLPNKGRIFRLLDPERKSDPTVAEVKKLLAEGFAKRPTDELARLLEHKDMRVRREAQFVLAERGEVEALDKVLTEKQGLARLNALWGLAQARTKQNQVHKAIARAAADKDAEVRAQAMKYTPILNRPGGIIAKGLADPEPRVRFNAAMAASRLGFRRGYGDEAITPALLEMIRKNADADPYLRHAGVMALAGLTGVIMSDADLNAVGEDASASVRLAALLAMRRRESPGVARFLTDNEPRIVLEAARAIYDLPIREALPKLAELARPGTTAKALPPGTLEPVVKRALAAHYRLGQKANAEALASFAARGEYGDKLREEALKLLQAWEKPSGRDRVVGLWRPLPERPAADVAAAIRPALAGIMTGPNSVRTEGAKLAAKHGIKEIGPALRELVLDKTRPAAVRVETLKALETLKDAELDKIAAAALADDDARLRREARRVQVAKLAKVEPDTAVDLLSKVIDKGATVERQGALALLADINAPSADKTLGQWLDRLLKDKAPPELALDIVQAAQKRTALKEPLARYEASRPKNNPTAAFRETLVGGDAEAGRKIFFEKAELSCLRCHKVSGSGGEVGPDLTGIAKKYQRDYLLESIVDPNKQIAKGYESVVLVLLNGQTKTGILRGEDAKEVRLMTAEGQLIAVPKAQIDERQRGPSAMPGDLAQKMTRTELRDLIEFLAGLH